MTSSPVTFDGVRGWSTPSPRSPSLVCLDKHSGKLIWEDNSPEDRILSGQWGSPLVVEIEGKPQVIAPQGDGWLRSFDPANGELIWEFDINFKQAKWGVSGGELRNTIVATPVFYKNRIYITAGRAGYEGEGPGRLCCINPIKRGDISSQLAVDANGDPLPRGHLQSVDSRRGERAVPNPNSGLIWERVELDQNGDGKLDSGERFGRSVASVSIKDDLLFAPTLTGFFFCLDSETGKEHWQYDALSALFAPPLIVGDKVFLADEDGMLSVFGVSSDPEQAMKRVAGELRPLNVDADGDPCNVGNSCHAMPVFANGTLFVAASNRLFAIEAEVGMPAGASMP